MQLEVLSHLEPLINQNNYDEYSTIHRIANLIGESLRARTFNAEGYGCYETFNLRQGYIPLPKDSKRGNLLLTSLGGNHNDHLECYHCPRDVAQLYTNGRDIDFGWFWDGDGTLMYLLRNREGEPKLLLENTDCKKSYTWTMYSVEGETANDGYHVHVMSW